MATNKPLFAVQSQNREQVSLCGIFSCTGTGAPVALTGARGWSVVRSATGTYTLSLSATAGFPYAVNEEAAVIGSSTAASGITVVQVSPLVAASGATPQTVQICTYGPTNATTNTLIALDVPTGYQISFRLDLLNSSVV